MVGVGKVPGGGCGKVPGGGCGEGSWWWVVHIPRI